jgi:hypothetical protein
MQVVDGPIDAMSGCELLDQVDSWAATQRRREAEILRAAVQHAILNNAETLDPELTKLPGRPTSGSRAGRPMR